MTRPCSRTVLAASVLTLACSPIGQGSDGAGGGRSRVQLAIDTVGTRGDGVDGVHLEIVKVAASAGAAPAVATGEGCEALGELRDLAAVVDVDLRRAGRTPAGAMELDAGPLGELRLLVRSADVDQGPRHRRGRGRETCADANGEQLIVVRLVPTERIELARDGEEDLVARLDARGDVEQQACNASDPDCDADVALSARRNADHGGGGGGGHGGGGGGGGHGGGGDDQGGGGGGDDHGGGGGGGGGGDGGPGAPGAPGDHGGGGGAGGDDGGPGDGGGGTPGDGGGGNPGNGGDQGGGGQGGGATRGSRFVITDRLPLSRAR